MAVSVVLATEDELSEAIGMRMLSEHEVLVRTPPMKIRRGGFGYLRSRMHSWKQMAQRQVVILLTDLDRTTCPVLLLEDWLGVDRSCPGNLIFRIAEREVESWLLADHVGIARFMGRNVKLPSAPDTLPDPKQFLLEQAKKAPRSIREDLIAAAGTLARQGLGYNARLVGWVESEWCPQRAAARSPSLARARRALDKAVALLKQKDRKL